MKLLSYAKDGAMRIGAAEPEGIVDLTGLLIEARAPVNDPSSMLALIRSGIDVDAVGGGAIERARAAGTLASRLVTDFAWLPPIPRPPKILAVALNFYAHVNETSEFTHYRDEPILFPKYTTNLLPHEGTILLPPFPQRVSEELEPAVVFSRDARHIRPSEAPDYVFGYTICNDVSARDRQRERIKMGQPYSYAKNMATFCPMGPWIVTRQELPSLEGLHMQVRNDGVVKREGSADGMIYNAFEVMAYCSDWTPMEAGDVITLGTFDGEKDIAPGQTLELEIERIGVLRNRVERDPQPWPNFPTDEPTGHRIRS
jgi:2,4-diketo-3-deoxy-L-fuconate hydrolase